MQIQQRMEQKKLDKQNEETWAKLWQQEQEKLAEDDERRLKRIRDLIAQSRDNLRQQIAERKQIRQHEAQQRMQEQREFVRSLPSEGLFFWFADFFGLPSQQQRLQADAAESLHNQQLAVEHRRQLAKQNAIENERLIEEKRLQQERLREGQSTGLFLVFFFQAHLCVQRSALRCR